MTTRVTKSQDVYRALSTDIGRGLLKPGTQLDETLIAERYGVSRTPIREAIRQLEAAGLVEARPHRGALVRSLSEQQLDEMFAVMAELEGLCARWSSFAMTAGERKHLQAVHAQAGHFVQLPDRAAYVAANDAFHSAIYEGAHNGYLAELTRSARRRVSPFRQAQFDEPGRLAKSHGEHDGVLDAILRGDGDAAYAAMRAHLSVVRTAVEEVAARYD